MGLGRAIDDDPLSRLLAPPPNETPEERELRVMLEAEARARSERIDDQIRAEKAALKKNKLVKVLLLGQSESGKSTTLKNFQLAYCQDQWEVERASWRTVIQLNLVRGINTILDLLAKELAGAPDHAVGDDSDVSDMEGPPSPLSRSGKPRAPKELHFSARHRLLKLRLAPLRTVQRDLEMRIGIHAGADVHDVISSEPSSPVLGSNGRKQQEFFVRSATSWKQLHSRMPSDGGNTKIQDAQIRETADIIAGCAEDMKAIWNDPVVREMLVRKGVRMEATPGFFLNDIDRIAVRDYRPTDSDVVRARLRTLGVQEHRIKFNKGPAAGSEWCIYDVGGSRTQRYAWYPYFDDCDAIIFLAPINCFDERLAEDRRVNRLEDSYVLWKAVATSKLLAKTSIILFLNKSDLLKEKLESGVLLRDHVQSYGDRPNDAESAIKYFQNHFRDILRKNSPEPRPFRAHITSVVDTKATAVTLSAVWDKIFAKNLKDADLA
ncbi:G-alpha-domain-containing protein [Lenzites betulinus]|nr:G-alpha-domain-containing protein [Lenzites betulinus]